MWDLDKQEKQLKHYQQTSDQLTQWTEDARQRLDALQAAKFRDVPALMDHLSQHKVGFYDLTTRPVVTILTIRSPALSHTAVLQMLWEAK